MICFKVAETSTISQNRMAQIENGNKAGYDSGYKRGRESVKGGLRFNQRVSKAIKRAKGVKEAAGRASGTLGASDAADRATWAAERASKAA